MARWTIHGISSRLPPRNAIRRGIELNPLSWFEVRTWTRLMTMPVTKPTASNGALIQNAATNIWPTICATPSGVMPPPSSKEPFHQRPDRQIPAVHEYEQQQLERRGHHRRRQLDHADRECHRGHDDVDEQKRQENHGADLKPRAHLGKN